MPCFFLVNEEVYRDGFLWKKFKSSFFATGEIVRPSEHELQDWRDAPPPSIMTTPEIDLPKKGEADEERDRKLMPPPSIPAKNTGPQQKMSLVVDDIVIVTHGDLMNMRAVVTRSDTGEPTVYVRPLPNQGIKEGIFQVAQERLSKYFELGDHVKSYCGEHIGNSGYVVQVNLRDTEPRWGFGATATVVAMSGDLAAEWKGVLNHIRITVERAAPQEEIGEYRVGDIVKFGNRNSVGLIIRLEAGRRALILDSNAQTQTANFGECVPISSVGKGSGREGSAKPIKGVAQQWAIDRKGRRITVGSNVHASR